MCLFALHQRKKRGGGLERGRGVSPSVLIVDEKPQGDSENGWEKEKGKPRCHVCINCE